MKQLLQARRIKESIDHYCPPMPMKNEGLGLTIELLNRPELLVGVVEATVKADFGLTSDITLLCSCFTALFCVFPLKELSVISS